FFTFEEVGRSMGERIGLIAGAGELPGILAARALERGNDVVVVRGLAGSVPSPPAGTAVYDVFVGEWDRVVGTLKSEGVTKAYLVGKMSREHLYGGHRFDERFLSLLASLQHRNDDAL